MNPLPESDKGFARNITLKEKSDIRTLMRFVEIYCREKQHQEKSQFHFKHPCRLVGTNKNENNVLNPFFIVRISK
jgi:hypothetical protein